MPTVIDIFRGNYEFLSNFYPSSIVLLGRRYQSTEHAFQSFKAAQFEDHLRIMACPTPGQAKRMGKIIPLIADWEEVKDGVMMTVVRAKFNQHPELAERLANTGDATLVEGNWWGDRHWGQVNGVGKNLLGVILMKLRNEIQTKGAC